MSEILQIIQKLLAAGKPRAARRVERLADEVPGVESQFSPRAIETSALDMSAPMSKIPPRQFETYARPLGREYERDMRHGLAEKWNSIEELLADGAPKFYDVPWLRLSQTNSRGQQGAGILPSITGHEGRHRMRGLAGDFDTSAVRLFPTDDVLRMESRRQTPDEQLDSAIAWVKQHTQLLPEKAEGRQDRRLLQPNIFEPFADGGRPTFDPESDDYDYDTAARAGMKRDRAGHMGSVAPVPGEPDIYRLLKGRKHPTWDKGVAAENMRGSAVVKREDGNYYSEPFAPGGGYADGGTPAQPRRLTPDEARRELPADTFERLRRTYRTPGTAFSSQNFRDASAVVNVNPDNRPRYAEGGLARRGFRKISEIIDDMTRRVRRFDDLPRSDFDVQVAMPPSADVPGWHITSDLPGILQTGAMTNRNVGDNNIQGWVPERVGGAYFYSHPALARAQRERMSEAVGDDILREMPILRAQLRKGNRLVSDEDVALDVPWEESYRQGSFATTRPVLLNQIDRIYSPDPDFTKDVIRDYLRKDRPRFAEGGSVEDEDPVPTWTPEQIRSMTHSTPQQHGVRTIPDYLRSMRDIAAEHYVDQATGLATNPLGTISRNVRTASELALPVTSAYKLADLATGAPEATTPDAWDVAGDVAALAGYGAGRQALRALGSVARRAAPAAAASAPFVAFPQDAEAGGKSDILRLARENANNETLQRIEELLGERQ